VKEFRFRGKRVDDGKWVYGGVFTDAYGDAYIVVNEEEIHGDAPPAIELYVMEYKVDRKTVGQWTGLQDTNSCDIYEDDILRAWESDTSYWTGRVYRHESGEWKVRLFRGTRWAEDALWIILRHGFRKVERIGNTHDNPKLLEVRDA
jgi:uncharacterized phage protein (TIGR01671 family)